MITQLLAEKKDEIKHKDFCIEEFNTNQLQTERKECETQDPLALIEDLNLTIKNLEASIDDLNMNIKSPTADFDNWKAQIAEMKTQVSVPVWTARRRTSGFR